MATMGRHLSPEERRNAVRLCKEGHKKVEVAELYGVSRQTIWRWCKRAKHRGRETFKDRPHRPHRIRRKAKKNHEDQIFFLRQLEFGTKRIVDALQKVPSYIKKEFEKRFKQLWEGIKISRTTVHKVLKLLGLNKPKRKTHKWKTIKTKRPNELWQIDLKESVRIDKEVGDILVVEDDYSRFEVCLEALENKKTDTITAELENVSKNMVGQKKY